jgi:hypothetical protein
MARTGHTKGALDAAVNTLIQDCRQVLSVPGTKAETSLYSQFEKFLQASLLSAHPSLGVVQQVNADAYGVPDYRISQGKELQGWLELKAVLGKDLNTFKPGQKDHDSLQHERFKSGLGNLIYTTGWQWRLYQNGRQVGRDVVLGPPDIFDPNSLPHLVNGQAISELQTLLENFAAASTQSYGAPDAAVEALAGRAKALNLALVQAGRANAGTHLAQLEADFKALLFKNGLPFTWERFVDSYVQLAVFGALLWRLETGARVSLDRQVGFSAGLHPLLAQCMTILWSQQSRIPILEPLLEELCRTINNIDPALFTPPLRTSSGKLNHRRYLPDPIVHAYEPFFKAYDPAAREASGVYYTPVEIVEQIVSGIGHHLRSALGLADGLLDPDAQYLDPATGTGTFLLGLANAVAAEATNQGLPIDTMVEQVLTKQTSAFELFLGPYTIAHQRLEVALKSFGVTPSQRLPIYLADTLEAPATGTLGTSGFGLAGVEIQKERANADRIKTADKVLVIFGNPPYERVLENQGGQFEPFAQGLLDEIGRRTPATHKRDLKSTKDLFVAFWAWALWALQDPKKRLATAASPSIDPADCHGIIGFVTNRTWISGRSLIGLRSLVSSGAKEIWILDLGGDSRGAHGAHSFAGGDANVFGIRTGVAISWIVFDRTHKGPPTVKYRRLFGSRREKLDDLAQPFQAQDYQTITGSVGDAFLPNGWRGSRLAGCPLLSDLFAVEPETGIQTARDKSAYSPVGPEASDVLARVGKTLIGRLGDWSLLPPTKRQSAWATAQSRRSGVKVPDPAKLDPSLMRDFVYRPLDIRWVYADPAWVDWWRPNLQQIYSASPTASLVTLPGDHGNGPTVMHVEKLMDQHSFRGSDGGKGVFPLWLPHEPLAPLPDARTAIRGDLRCSFSGMVYDWLDKLNRAGRVEDAYDFILAVLSAPEYSQRYWAALESDFLRVPLTTDSAVFDSGVSLGRRLRQAWTLDVPKDSSIGWQGKATRPALGKANFSPAALTFDNGRILTGVTSRAWSFQVSNYPVLKNWFEARTHWTATPAQSKQAMAVVTAVTYILALEPALNQLLDDATATC